ncbi:MAG: hypothetical protein KJ955_06300 [Nanoarchaeota archaeon]|nr:hypothetical protein [Nanoarchaeota archaeon]
MKLTKEDTDLFYKLNWPLLFYANQKHNVIPCLKEPDFKKEDLEKVARLHEKLNKEPALIDSFIAENPFKLNQEELDIVRSWKKAVRGKFLVMKHTEQGAIFFEETKDPKAYAVLGLYDDFDMMIPKEYLPVVLETVLIPFKGKIIYNGIFMPYNIHFGKSIRNSFEMSFRESKSKYGILTSLEEPVIERSNAEEELMKTYARNKGTCFNYEKEINQLLKKNPSLWKIYYQTLGKSEVRKVNKRLSELGVNSAYFAIFDDIVIASGQTEKELSEAVARVLPPEKREYAYIFKYKGRQE